MIKDDKRVLTYKKHFLSPLFLLLFFLIASCGDMNKKDNGRRSASLETLTCELDTEAFTKIFERNIKGEILCLQDTIHVFIELVKTDRPGFISEKTLINFIENGPIDFGDEDMVPLVRGLFDLTYLLIGGDKGYISRQSFDQLIELLIDFNQNVFPIHEIFTSDSELSLADYERNRNIVRKYIVIIANKVERVFQANRAQLDRIDLEQLIERFLVKDPDIAVKAKAVLFLKRMFLGGSVDELTHLELAQALAKLPELGEVAYDLVKLGRFNFKDNAQIMIDEIFLKDIQVVKKNLHYTSDRLEALFTIPDVLNVLDVFEVNLMDIEFRKYPNEIEKIKKALLGSGGSFFTSVDVVAGLEHLKNILDKGSFFYRVYRMFADELDSPRPITQDFSSFPVDNSREAKFLEHFAQITQNYRFFKGNQKAPQFSFLHQRNPQGVWEVSVIEYVVTLLMREYGQSNSAARGGYHMTLEQTLTVVDDIKRFLRDFGILKVGKLYGGEVLAVAENMVLMSTLFQYQSNGCDDFICMEVPEASEFLLSIVTALSIRDFFTDSISELCYGEQDEFGRIYPECFERNFFKVLKKPNPQDSGRSLSHYLPLLSSYLYQITQTLPPHADPTESAQYRKFLAESQAFTRVCRYYDTEEKEPVPLEPDDAFSVFAGMLSIESTILKFDKNENNQIDGFGARNEVLDAYYSTYEGAIKALVAEEAGPFMTRFSLQIFQYLVKYGKVPDANQFGSVWEFAKFLLKFNKNANVTRTTVATILRVLSEQNTGDNIFKCDQCARDPNVNCVPVQCHMDSEGQIICYDDPWE